ncbi:unnamed protein product [Urochloa decumbens]|uniref:Protein kinase domain-containing protein n=1 Tax=Urochloa decumbens TaxID=240449 RepID=A0ABC8ZS44_9POAL
MAISAVFHGSATFLWVLAFLVANVWGRHHKSRYACSPFSCGGLTNVSHPFRQRGDPAGCGFLSYELDCSDGKATIHINTGTYYVVNINYTASSFWVVDVNLNMQSTCPHSRWDQFPQVYGHTESQWDTIGLAPSNEVTWASFLNCSQAVWNNGRYKPVACLSTSNSFIYVATSKNPFYVGDLEASCGHFAMVPLGGWGKTVPENASFEDVVRFMRNGFAVRFPYPHTVPKLTTREISFAKLYRIFLEDRNNYHRILYLLWVDFYVWNGMLHLSKGIALALLTVKLIAVLCRFVLAPLAVLIFLAHKYLKTRITIDAVEKFLRMQHMIGPTRYTYTNIIVITSHFREKLGQGGYGSVYKGVLLPGDVHVAVKMLSNSKCNGEEFISEVSTIGRIHHVNVVRLVGFCSEEMRRALVYEYMPNGSLEKYIFSPEKRFSWDKLNKIALGIARGINYLHQDCDMQILHFDIKPHNILLDNNFVPKVADFGLAKLYPRDNSFVPVSAKAGTIGYMAPERIFRCFGALSSKSDVYSFGMLLLEMAGGRRNADNAANSSQVYYPSWVYSQLARQPVLGEIGEAVDMHKLEKKLCIVGLKCIQMKPQDRPTMGEVIEMLEAGIDGLQVPPRPFFCDDEGDHVVGNSCLTSELDEIDEDE